MIPRRYWLCILIFSYLQVLDFVTTIAGFRVGLVEANPFVRWLAQIDPLVGVGACKMLAFLLGFVCYALQRYTLLWHMNYWYVGVVSWNLMLIVFVRLL